MLRDFVVCANILTHDHTRTMNRKSLMGAVAQDTDPMRHPQACPLRWVHIRTEDAACIHAKSSLVLTPTVLPWLTRVASLLWSWLKNRARHMSSFSTGRFLQEEEHYKYVTKRREKTYRYDSKTFVQEECKQHGCVDTHPLGRMWQEMVEADSAWVLACTYGEPYRAAGVGPHVGKRDLACCTLLQEQLAPACHKMCRDLSHACLSAHLDARCMKMRSVPMHGMVLSEPYVYVCVCVCVCVGTHAHTYACA